MLFRKQAPKTALLDDMIALQPALDFPGYRDAPGVRIHRDLGFMTCSPAGLRDLVFRENAHIMRTKCAQNRTYALFNTSMATTYNFNLSNWPHSQSALSSILDLPHCTEPNKIE